METIEVQVGEPVQVLSAEDLLAKLQEISTDAPASGDGLSGAAQSVGGAANGSVPLAQ